MAKESYASRYHQVEHHLHTLLAQKKIVLMGKIGDQINDQRFLLMNNQEGVRRGSRSYRDSLKEPQKSEKDWGGQIRFGRS